MLTSKLASKLVCLSVLVLFLCGAGAAQRPGPEFRRRLACEPLEPRTRLEAFDARFGTVLFKGFTRVAALDLRDGEARVDAIELRDMGNSTRTTGIVIALKETGEGKLENRAFIDYDEIDLLLKGIDAVARVNETMTKLTGFEGRYRTNGDLEVSVFRQTRAGTAVTLSSGICDRVTLSMTLDDLGRLRGIISEAKGRLDEIK
jgi:hypothetical protein